MSDKYLIKILFIFIISMFLYNYSYAAENAKEVKQEENVKIDEKGDAEQSLSLIHI